jgi:RHS repeat-associated protein
VTQKKSAVIASDDYYPGGATFNSYTRENSVKNSDLYQSKEWQDELGLNLYDFEWRQYDPFIWRTPTIDPLAEEFYEHSPYSWAGNNPLLNIDPDGQDWYSFTNEQGKQTTVWREGDSKQIEIDGTKYQNIGGAYTQTLEDGTKVQYDQNEVVNVTEDTDKSIAEKPYEFGKDFDVVVDNRTENEKGGEEVINFAKSFIPVPIREILGIEVDQTQTTAPDGLFPLSPRPKPSGDPSQGFAHKRTKQSTGKAGKGKHEKGEARDKMVDNDKKRQKPNFKRYDGKKKEN